MRKSDRAAAASRPKVFGLCAVALFAGFFTHTYLKFGNPLPTNTVHSACREDTQPTNVQLDDTAPGKDASGETGKDASGDVVLEYFEEPEYKELPQALLDVVSSNRQALSSVSSWVKKEDWASPPSLFNYGLPGYALPSIDKDVGIDVMYADLITYLAQRLPQPIRYLEIGVSVGKTFFQQVRNLPKRSASVAFDIEDINPTLANLLGGMEVKERWTEHRYLAPTPNYKSPRAEKGGSVSQAKNRDGGDVFYVASDEFDDEGWARLKGLGWKYNLIYLMHSIVRTRWYLSATSY